MATLFVYIWQNFAALHVPDVAESPVILAWTKPKTVIAYPDAEANPAELSGDDYEVPEQLKTYPNCQWMRFPFADNTKTANFIEAARGGAKSCFKTNSLGIVYYNSFSLIAGAMQQCFPDIYARQRNISKIWGSWDHKNLYAYCIAIANSEGYYDLHKSETNKIVKEMTKKIKQK